MKRIFIVGNLGNMARRYTAILRTMGIDVYGVDKENQKLNISMDDIDGIIIASPSKFHTMHIRNYLEYGKPILCEKPIAFSVDDLDQLNRLCGKDLRLLTMVNQYKYLVRENISGLTMYDYFNTGKNGLAWDTINIIGQAKGECVIDNKSPVWMCQINGQKLNIQDMDKAYIAMIKDWVNDPKHNWEYIYEAHRKVVKWQKS